MDHSVAEEIRELREEIVYLLTRLLRFFKADEVRNIIDDEPGLEIFGRILEDILNDWTMPVFCESCT